jgi:hypothetical protein
LGLNLTAKSAAQKSIMSGQQTTEIQSTGSSVNVGLQVSLRDYFAAHAINEVGWYNNINQSAIMAYEIADAMIKARGAK